MFLYEPSEEKGKGRTAGRNGTGDLLRRVQGLLGWTYKEARRGMKEGVQRREEGEERHE